MKIVIPENYEGNSADFNPFPAWYITTDLTHYMHYNNT